MKLEDKLTSPVELKQFILPLKRAPINRCHSPPSHLRIKVPVFYASASALRCRGLSESVKRRRHSIGVLKKTDLSLFEECRLLSASQSLNRQPMTSSSRKLYEIMEEDNDEESPRSACLTPPCMDSFQAEQSPLSAISEENQFEENYKQQTGRLNV